MFVEKSAKKDVIQDRCHCVADVYSILYFVFRTNDAPDKHYRKRNPLGFVFWDGKNSTIRRNYHPRGRGYQKD